MTEVDLARLAWGYRHRQPSQASLDRAEDAGADLPAGSKILDIGGGPGYHSAVWADQGHHPLVLDPSMEMTYPAVDRAIPVILEVSQALPFRDASFDLVWFHLSLHYGDWRDAIDEAVRVTTNGGRVEVWTLASDHHSGSILARWFPSVSGIDDSRFPDAADVETYLGRHVRSVGRKRVVERRTRAAGEWVAAAEAGFVSTLQLLDEAELAAGLAAFRREYPDPSVAIDYELRFDRIVATS